MYLIVGACFCLAGFVAVDLAATGWIAVLLRLVGDGPRRWSPVQRRRFFAAVRVLPCAAGVLFAALVVGPGYAWLEPRGAREVGSSRVDLQACKLEYSIVSPK